MDRIKVTTVDIDSCIADTRHRWHMFRGKDTDWLAYALAGVNDIPTKLAVIKWFTDGTKIIFVSSRPEGARTVTLNWLNRLGIEYLALVLDDSEEAITDFKVNAIRKINEVYDVVAHIDDRQEILDAIHDEFGIDTYRVVAYND